MKITILGTGAFGLSLGSLWEQYAEEVNITFYTPFIEEFEEITQKHTREKVLPNIILKDDLKITMNLEEALSQANLVVVAVPCGAVRNVLEQVKKVVKGPHHYLFVSKGLEKGTNNLMSDLFTSSNLEGTFSFLAGPTFAKELIQNIPTGMTLASKDKETIRIVNQLFKNTEIKIETREDLLGVQYASVIKNILAIFMGALGTKYPVDSTKAYFMTEIFHQMKSLILSLGGQKETIDTYAGIGDLLLTCNSLNSRNYRYGRLLEENREEAEAFLHHNTVEGRYALSAMLSLCQEKKIKVPLLTLMQSYIDQQIDLKEVFQKLKEEG